MTNEKEKFTERIAGGIHSIFGEHQKELGLENADYSDLIHNEAEFLVYLTRADSWLYRPTCSTEELIEELKGAKSHANYLPKNKAINKDRVIEMLNENLGSIGDEIKEKYNKFVKDLNGEWRTAEGSTKVVELNLEKRIKASFYENYKEYNVKFCNDTERNYSEPIFRVKIGKENLGVAKAIYCSLLENKKYNPLGNLSEPDKKKVFTLGLWGLLREKKAYDKYRSNLSSGLML